MAGYIPQKILLGNTGGLRTRWLDDVKDDLQKMRYSNWKALMQKLDNWWKTVAMLHNGLQTREEEEDDSHSDIQFQFYDKVTFSIM